MGSKRRRKETKAEQRVAIARDALAWIEAEALIPAQGGYVRFHMDHGLLNLPSDQQLRDAKLGPCRVCGIGAVFIAKAVRYNKVTVGDLNSGQYHRALKDTFSRQQMLLIETAFEQSDLTSPYSAETAKESLAVDRAREFCTSDKTAVRLIAILNNIIANNGTFKP